MSHAHYTFEIETENYLNIISKVLNVFSRRRISILKIDGIVKGDKQIYKVTIYETWESALIICKQIDKYIDVLEVRLSEHLN